MTKGCYTCRRRRIICDNGQPTCRKCRDAGKECLGYQKPLVWVKGGVASRGKMMGRSFDEVKKPASESESQPPTESQVSSIPSSGLDLFSAAESLGTELPSFDKFVQRCRYEHGARSPSSPVDYIPAPWGLVDPLVKDFGQLSRFYLFHYNQYMVEDFVVYSESKNSWRDIIALVGHSPLLAHALTTLGALHYSLISSSDSAPMPWSSSNLATTNSLLSPGEIENMVTPAGARRPSTKAYQHFLEFKQRALNQLTKDLCSPVMQKDDRTLVAIVVLALLDLFESGSGAWSYHIEGAKKLLRSRPENELGQGILQGLETFAIDGCLIMEIMGSTLARPGALSKPFYSASMGPAMLKRLEETSWVGCPAYLLEVIFFVHGLWYPDSEIAAAIPQPTALPVTMQRGQPLSLASYAALLQGIRNFDPFSWAEGMQAHYYLPDLSHRIALAISYQKSVYLYTSRVLSRTREGYAPAWTDVALPTDHSRVANELVAQVCSIPTSDPHFKCLIWPTFIAGAESRRLAQRPLILEKLGSIYQVVTSVNVRNAAWVLRLMWQKQDLKETERHANCAFGDINGGMSSASLKDNDDDDFDSSFDWVDELDESRLDWLFI
ncbi:Protein of unknown function DUF3468 [Penicillium capsulatum]|uniref:Zn(2)-C6 fungal-type domain-containing protein n=1 Tax=Penicillium capsulatum TaxID=69766 RepID=A0A9W9HQ50_9EURO|nr:Protein of unknown function DUF3468 [Penicillium capsulatum]